MQAASDAVSRSTHDSATGAVACRPIEAPGELVGLVGELGAGGVERSRP